jgi:hypothetical protein
LLWVKHSGGGGNIFCIFCPYGDVGVFWVYVVGVTGRLCVLRTKIQNILFHPLQRISDRGWTGHVARIGWSVMCLRILMGKPEGKRPLGRLRHRWVGGWY